MEHISPRPGRRKVKGKTIDAFGGMTRAQETEWEATLEKKGRVPFIVYPVLCARCGQLWPTLFMVPNEEWKRYVEPAVRREVLCRRCYGWITKVIEEARSKQGRKQG